MTHLHVGGEAYGTSFHLEVDLGRVREAWEAFSADVRRLRAADVSGPRPGVARAKVRCACGSGPDQHLNDGVFRTCTACGSEV